MRKLTVISFVLLILAFAVFAPVSGDDEGPGHFIPTRTPTPAPSPLTTPDYNAARYKIFIPLILGVDNEAE